MSAITTGHRHPTFLDLISLCVQMQGSGELSKWLQRIDMNPYVLLDFSSYGEKSYSTPEYLGRVSVYKTYNAEIVVGHDMISFIYFDRNNSCKDLNKKQTFKTNDFTQTENKSHPNIIIGQTPNVHYSLSGDVFRNYKNNQTVISLNLRYQSLSIVERVGHLDNNDLPFFINFNFKNHDLLELFITKYIHIVNEFIISSKYGNGDNFKGFLAQKINLMK